MGEAIKDASACEACRCEGSEDHIYKRQNILHGLSEFSDRLATEVERVISTVGGRPNTTTYAQAVN